MTSEYPTAHDIKLQPPKWLASRRVWLLWKLEPGEPKPRKVPYWANGRRRSGELGAAPDLKNLVTYATAVRAAKKHGMRIGLAVVNGLAFVDLDDCLKNGEPNELAIELSAMAPEALTEVSQSGNGLHLLGLTQKQLQVSLNRKALGFEAYTYGRFCAWTGNLVTAGEKPCDMDKLLEELLSRADQTPRNVVPFVPDNSKARLLYDNSPEALAKLLSRLPNDDWDWDTYFQVLCAAKNELPGQDGLELFLSWAAKSEKFNEQTSRKDWRSMKPRDSNARRYTAATLVHLLKPENQPKLQATKPADTTASADDPYRFEGYVDTLLDLEFPQVDWIVDELIPPGLVLLAGPPKAGKSRFNLQLGLCVSTGVPFLGQRTSPGHVLYLSLEDPVQLTQERLLGTAKKLNIRKLGKQFYLGTVWDQGAEAVIRARKALELQVQEGHTPRLLIIDVLQRIRDAGEQKKPQYEVDYNALLPWAELRRDFPTLAIVITHHTRKAEAEDPFDAISGTQGIAGSVDSMLMLRRPGKHAIGGDVEDDVKDRLLFYARSRYRKQGDFESVLRSEEHLLSMTGEKPWELVGSGRQNEILKLMLTDTGKTWTSTEIHARVGEGTKLGTTQKHLQRMVKKGMVIGDNGIGYRVVDDSTKF